jgi:hypothetical protein
MATTDPNAIAPPTDPLQTTNPPGISGGLIQTTLGGVTPPTNTTATPPLQPIAPVTGYTAATGQAGTATATGYNATPYEVSAGGLVQNQVKDIVAEDSPLMQQARVHAAQQMNARGLLNSSLNTQAGQEAVISQALPMAQANAQAINAASTNTANARNTASQFRAAAENSASSLNAQLLTTMNQSNAAGQNAALNATAAAANQRALSVLDNNSKQSLAMLQAQNQQLLQSNTNASNLMTAAINNIAQIAQNPNLDGTAKRLAIDSQMNLLNEGLRTTAEISSTEQKNVTALNLDQYFGAGSAGTAGGTMNKPATVAEANASLASLGSQITAAQARVNALAGAIIGGPRNPQGMLDLANLRNEVVALKEQRDTIQVQKVVLGGSSTVTSTLATYASRIAAEYAKPRTTETAAAIAYLTRMYSAVKTEARAEGISFTNTPLPTAPATSTATSPTSPTSALTTAFQSLLNRTSAGGYTRYN